MPERYYDDGSPMPQPGGGFGSVLKSILGTVLNGTQSDVKLAEEERKRKEAEDEKERRQKAYDQRKKAAYERQQAGADFAQGAFQNRLNEAITTGAQPTGPALVGTQKPIAKMSLDQLQTPGAVNWEQGQSTPMTETQAREQTFGMEQARRPQATPTQRQEAPVQAAAATAKMFEPEKPKGGDDRPTQSEIREAWVDLVDSQFDGDEFEAFKYAKERSPAFANRVKAESIFNPEKRIGDLEDEARSEYVREKRAWLKEAKQFGSEAKAVQFIGPAPTIENIIFDPDYGNKYDALKRAGKYMDPAEKIRQGAQSIAEEVYNGQQPAGATGQPAPQAGPAMQSPPTDTTALIQSLEQTLQQELQSTQSLEQRLQALEQALLQKR